MDSSKNYIKRFELNPCEFFNTFPTMNFPSISESEGNYLLKKKVKPEKASKRNFEQR